MGKWRSGGRGCACPGKQCHSLSSPWVWGPILLQEVKMLSRVPSERSMFWGRCLKLPPGSPYPRTAQEQHRPAPSITHSPQSLPPFCPGICQHAHAAMLSVLPSSPHARARSHILPDKPPVLTACLPFVPLKHQTFRDPMHAILHLLK